MQTVMDGEKIMNQLEAMRKTRCTLNRRIKKYRQKMEPLSLFQALQEKRAAVYGADSTARDYGKIIEGEKAIYEMEISGPMEKYLEGVESLSPLMVSLPMKEAAALMLYYGLGKSWGETARALHMKDDIGRVRSIMREALSHSGVPARIIGGRLDLFPRTDRTGRGWADPPERGKKATPGTPAISGGTLDSVHGSGRQAVPMEGSDRP